MPLSKRSHEGYLLIDHRAGDGLSEDAAHATGSIAVRGGSMFETSTYTCSHCKTVVIINPQRTRERGYCPKCDHYICDACEALRVASGGTCKTFNQLADEVCEAAMRGKFICN